MDGFDSFVVMLIVLLGLRSAMRGLFREIGSLAGIVGGIILGRLFGETVGSMFKSFVKIDMVANAIGFTIVCMGVGIGASIVSRTMSMIVNKAGLGAVNRIGGFLVGALQGLLVAGCVLYIATAGAGALNKTFAANSIFAPYIMEFVRLVTGMALGAGSATKNV